MHLNKKWNFSHLKFLLCRHERFQQDTIDHSEPMNIISSIFPIGKWLILKENKIWYSNNLHYILSIWIANKSINCFNYLQNYICIHIWNVLCFKSINNSNVEWIDNWVECRNWQDKASAAREWKKVQKVCSHLQFRNHLGWEMQKSLRNCCKTNCMSPQLVIYQSKSFKSRFCSLNISLLQQSVLCWTPERSDEYLN